MSEPQTVLQVDDLKKHFPIRGLLGLTKAKVHAVDGVSFSIQRGQTLGLVGESGSGKSTVGKAVLRLLEPTAGSIKLNGNDITHTRGESLRGVRRDMQTVFQDPYASLNPRLPVERSYPNHWRTMGLSTRRIETRRS